MIDQTHIITASARSAVANPWRRRQKRQTIAPARKRDRGCRINRSIADHMRSGPDQPSRGRYNANRPFKPQTRPSQRNLSFDSNGPSAKIRGSANQIFERYVALAREAAIGGDPITAENFYQHAEHYFRVAQAARDGDQQGTQPRVGEHPDAETGRNEFAAGRGRSQEDEDDQDRL